MMEPLDLWADHQLTLQERYEAWRGSRDGILCYQSIVARAERLRERGWRHFGIAALWEAARYDRALEIGPDAQGFKINNDYRSRMAREIMAREVGLVDFFETRELKAV